MPPITLTQLGSLIDGDGLKKDHASYNEISSNAKLAAMASEDQLFPDHHGFDWSAIQKSVQINPKKKNKIAGAGASTISQQTAKNVFLWQGRGWFRKALETYFTFMIELVWGKKRILEVYLNVIETGKGIYGIEAASRNYFNKSAAKLGIYESAMIAACLPNPKRFPIKPMSRYVSMRHPVIVRQMANLRDDEDIIKIIK